MAATVDQKLLRQTKFPPEFSQKVDMKKINVEVMKKWIAGKITEILGSDDDVVIELCFNLLEGSRYPDVKSLQISLTGFLDKDAAKFCKELWNLCLSAQSNPQGVPKELLEAKKLELMQEKVDTEKAAEDTKQKKDREAAREQEIDNIRQRERAERGRGRGRGRGGRGGYDQGRFRESRSPPPRRRSPMRGPPPRREVDTYIPRGRGGPRANGRGRSPTRSKSASRSPPRRKRLASRSESPSRSPTASRSPPRNMPRAIPAKRSRSANQSKDRSSSRSVSSRSRSPRRRHQRKARSPSESRSRSPPRRKHRRRSYSSSQSRSRSPPRRRGGGHGAGRRRSPSYAGDHKDKRADIVRSHPNRDAHRLSRSPDHSPEGRRSHSRSRSRSGSPPRREKRRRSLQRYDPRHRRNTSSSASSPEQKRRKRSDSLDGSPIHNPS